jgi:hypothetical protein
MTDKAWMNKLRKVLGSMPKNRALHIKLEYNGSASVELCVKRDLEDFYSGEDCDLMKHSDDVKPLEYFSAPDIYPNSECC